MKLLKGILLTVVGLIVLALVTALFVEKKYALEREIVISKPKNEVFNYIKYLKNQDQFSVWASMDPTMKKEYRGTDGTVGFVSGWDSSNEDVGKGEQEIKRIVEGERVDYELRFMKPMESTEQAYMTTESVTGNQTKVKWGFRGEMDYPMNFMLLFMDMEEMLAKDFETGLIKLKANLEH